MFPVQEFFRQRFEKYSSGGLRYDLRLLDPHPGPNAAKACRRTDVESQGLDRSHSQRSCRPVGATSSASCESESFPDTMAPARRAMASFRFRPRRPLPSSQSTPRAHCLLSPWTCPRSSYIRLCQSLACHPTPSGTVIGRRSRSGVTHQRLLTDVWLSIADASKHLTRRRVARNWRETARTRPPS